MVVEIKNLIKRYGDKLAVDNMSLSINKGEILGLLPQVTDSNEVKKYPKLSIGSAVVYNHQL